MKINVGRSMSSAEAIDLLSGSGMWRTAALPHLGLPSIVMTDGTYGVRYSASQIEGDADEELDLAAFLGVVSQRARDIEQAFGASKRATCFPNGSSLGCSWDVDMAYALGEALAAECRYFGVHALLGPGINIRRTPLGGRGYEYYSEDPILSGDLAASVIGGLQDNGVGATLKHFACNNSEIERTTMDSVVDERSFREIYLLAFERAIAKANPWMVMSSYNRLNGVQVAENAWLLTTVLRDEWKYDGVVVSDWHGIKDRPASLIAGNDLDMPEDASRKRSLLAAIEDGSVAPEIVERSVSRMKRLIERVSGDRGAKPACDFSAHHMLARRMASESMVLLKNDSDLLPLAGSSAMRIAVIGAAARHAIIQGSGCATTVPTEVDDPLREIVERAGPQAKVTFSEGYSSDATLNARLVEEAVREAAAADVVIVFVNSDVTADGEGADRRDLHLSSGQDSLVDALAKASRNLIVVAAMPDAIEMPWIDDAGAVVAAFFAGQGMGGALADILFGLVNPSGKLSVTFPFCKEHIPGYLTYPGEYGTHNYAEGLYVGYRHYDSRKIAPLLCFGHGLSYTTFEYSNLVVEKSVIGPDDPLAIRFDVSNVGQRAGKEVCQLYLGWDAPTLHRPDRELKGFAKVALEAGETKTVRIEVCARDLRYYDPSFKTWLLDTSDITILVAASSRDVRLEGKVSTSIDIRPPRLIALDTQPKHVLANAIAKAHFQSFFEERFGVDKAQAKQMIEYCGASFFGIFTTINYFFKKDVGQQEVSDLIDRINRETIQAFSVQS